MTPVDRRCAARKAAPRGDAFDIDAELDPNAGPLKKAMQLLDKAAGATHAEKHTPATLQIMDQRIDRCRGEGIAANKKRVDGKSLTQQRMPDMAVHQPGDGPVAPQAQKRRHLSHHRGEAGERTVGKFLEADLENSLGCLKQPGIALHVRWREALDFTICILNSGPVVKLATIIKMEPVPRVERPEIKVILALLPEQFEQLVKQEGGGYHRWAGIMAKTATFKHLCPPANGLKPVHQGNGIAACPHAQCGGNAAKSGADDKYVTGVGRIFRGVCLCLSGRCHGCFVSLCSARPLISDIPVEAVAV